MKRLALFLALFASAGCDLIGPVTGPIPPGTVAVPPQPGYTALRAQVEQCSGLKRDFAEMHWFMVPEVLDFEYDGVRVFGIYQYPARITLAEYAMDMDTVVAHEILHALLAGRRVTGHPAEYFQQKCGAIVGADR